MPLSINHAALKHTIAFSPTALTCDNSSRNTQLAHVYKVITGSHCSYFSFDLIACRASTLQECSRVRAKSRTKAR